MSGAVSWHPVRMDDWKRLITGQLFFSHVGDDIFVRLTHGGSHADGKIKDGRLLCGHSRGVEFRWVVHRLAAELRRAGVYGIVPPPSEPAVATMPIPKVRKPIQKKSVYDQIEKNSANYRRRKSRIDRSKDPEPGHSEGAGRGYREKSSELP